MYAPTYSYHDTVDVMDMDVGVPIVTLVQLDDSRWRPMRWNCTRIFECAPAALVGQ